MNTLQLIDDLKKDTADILNYTQNVLVHLPEEKLMQRTDPKRWSVLECLEHMNLSSGHYIKRLQKAIPAAVRSGQSFQQEFKPGYFGQKFSVGMLPNEDGSLNNSMKTFFFFEPKQVPKKKLKAMEEFIQMNEITLELLEKSKAIDLNKNKITSTLGPVFRFKAGDAFRFAIAHNIRHMVQLKKVVNSLE